MATPTATIDPEHTARATLPVAPNFPVRWERPDDLRLFWTFMPTHFPDPIAPVEAWLNGTIVDGLNRAAETYRLPIRAASRRISTYFYFAVFPAPGGPLPPTAPATQGGVSPELDAAMAHLGDAWRREWLPEVRRYLDGWEAFDLAGASPAALLEHLDQTVAWTARLYVIHWLGWLPAYMAISLFDDLYREVCGDADVYSAYRLLQGFDNMTLEVNRAIWALSRRALALADVRAALERDAAGVLAALETTTAGRAFRADLQTFLDRYGRRGDRWGLANAYWIEDPAPVVESLKDYVAQPDRDPPAELAALAAERERLVAAARERLVGQPPATSARFERLLTAAQSGTVFAEDHGFWIDSCGLYQVRRVFLEFGRRFAASGTLAQPEDVFYLTLEEVRETAAGAPRLDRRGLAAARLAEMAYFRTIVPPPALGTPPSGPPPDDSLSRTFAKFFGAPPPAAEPATLPGVLRGSAGSPGIVRGPARVIRSLAEAGKLHPGDVLVAVTTAPPWTPLFATAAAIVTDTGGILSHCAVVAREYGIPAVVGTGNATTVVRDGQLLEVDGSAGVVRIVVT
jgi:pyruvate,water dikinase